MRIYLAAIAISALALLVPAQKVHAQAFGIELHSNLNPVAGGMGGVAIAKAHDVQSTLTSNPATLADFHGTQFSTGGAWLEPTFNMAHTGTNLLPGVTPFSGKSEAEGSALGGFALAQDLRALGMPVTVGMGLSATAGAGLSFKQFDGSNGTSDVISALHINTAVGVELTDRLNAGVSLGLGTTNLYGPFIGLSSQAYDYALRASLGLSYDLTDRTTLGFYYQTEQSHNFDDVVRLQLPGGGFSTFTDIDLDLPQNVGIGIANDRLCCGRLLLAADLLYKNWEEAAFFDALLDDQWALQMGAQYKWSKRIRLRAGYVYADNATRRNPGREVGGVVPPGLQNAIQYLQAQLPAINNHRISAGVGIQDMLPGVDANLFAGGMFDADEYFGSSFASLESYWIGLGLTWRFGRGHCCDMGIPNDWCSP